MARTVFCAKLGRELPGLDEVPFPGPLGQRIYDDVSREAWRLWPNQETILINHYGLNLADGKAQAFLMEQMEEFYFGEGARMPEGWTPPSQGQQTKGGAPRKK